MARLTRLPDAVASLPPTLGRLDRAQYQRDRDAVRRRGDNLRGLYNTKRWRVDTRPEILERDGWLCRGCEVPHQLTDKHSRPDSAIVDHIKKPEGNLALFWDWDNLQSVCKAYHDSEKQKLEKGGAIALPHPEWMPRAIIPVELVCGPPASGKTRYVAERAGPADLVVDLDVIAGAMAGTAPHAWDRAEWLGLAMRERNSILGRLDKPGAYPKCWLIVAEPLAKWRQWWVDRLGAQRVTVLEVEYSECMRRSRLDADRSHDTTDLAVAGWWDAYTRRPQDITL